jgi:hypothetical protein
MNDGPVLFTFLVQVKKKKPAVFVSSSSDAVLALLASTPQRAADSVPIAPPPPTYKSHNKSWIPPAWADLLAYSTRNYWREHDLTFVITIVSSPPTTHLVTRPFCSAGMLARPHRLPRLPVIWLSRPGPGPSHRPALLPYYPPPPIQPSWPLLATSLPLKVEVIKVQYSNKLT